MSPKGLLVVNQELTFFCKDQVVDILGFMAWNLFCGHLESEVDNKWMSVATFQQNWSTELRDSSVLEHLPNSQEALGFVSSTANKEEFILKLDDRLELLHWQWFTKP